MDSGIISGTVITVSQHTKQANRLGIQEIIPCPNPSCPNYGNQCRKCCNHCGKDIFWRPPLLDKEIAYQGPKPLNQNGSVHRCMLQGTRDGQYYHTAPTSTNAPPSWITKHLQSMSKFGFCMFNSCYCHEIAKAKDPIILAEWNKKNQEWLDKWEGTKK